MANNWTESELVLALDLYLREPRCSRQNPQLAELAARLDRSLGSVYARLQNFKSVDPNYSGAGLSAGKSVCEPIWTAYAHRLRDNENVDSILQKLNEQEQATWLNILRSLVTSSWKAGQVFTLDDAYEFESTLASQFPNNKNVQAKIRQTLQQLRDAGEIEFADGKGSYKLTSFLEDNIYPDEEVLDPALLEGSVCKVFVNAYERSRTARDACIQHHTCRCSVCDLSFDEKYGDIGKGYIHVHHLRPLSSIGNEYIIDPKNDLVPVCPNCHAMLHRKNPPLTIDELRAMLI